MKTLFIECNMGAAGDMLMGALYSLLTEEQKTIFLKKINAISEEVHVIPQETCKQGIGGIHMKVEINGEEEGVEHTHEHHHDHDCCGHDHHHHHHHHGHDADEVFISWGEETHKKFTKAEIERILKALEDADAYGIVLRAKGYVANAEGEKWIHFDYVPGEPDIRDGGAMVTGRICVIGSKLNEEAVAKLFGVEKQ